MFGGGFLLVWNSDRLMMLHSDEHPWFQKLLEDDA